MRRYQPSINPNDFPVGYIIRGRNGLYWIVQGVSETDNTHVWELYEGRIPDEISEARSSLTSEPELDTDDNASQPTPIPTSRILDQLNEAPRMLRHSPGMYDLIDSGVREGQYQHRPLTRSYAMTNLDESDFIPSSSEEQHLPRTIRYTDDDQISYMSFSTDSADDRHSVYAGQEQEPEEFVESDYEEDSEDYNNIQSDANSVVNYKSNILDKCLNESPVTLSNYEETDLNDLFIIHLQNQEGKFIKGSCLRRDEMRDILKSDINSFPPSYLMSIYQTPSSGRQDDLLTGLTGKPTGKIIIRLPTNQIYVTFGSLHRVLSSPVTQWYALPLYGGKLRRVGNVGGIYGASMNHGQVPGFKIYKLFTHEDIQNNVIAKETADDFPHMYEHDTMLSLFDLVGDTPVNIFIKNVINTLIDTQIRRRPFIPPRNSSLMSRRERRIGNPPDI